MLTDADNDETFSRIVSWQPHGRAFAVHDKDRFIGEIMPRYFKQSRFSSFLRQLNLYNFVRIKRDNGDKGGYYHELCLRGRSELCALIERTGKEGSSKWYYSPPHLEPDFFRMPSVEPTMKQDQTQEDTNGYSSEKEENQSLLSSLKPSCSLRDKPHDAPVLTSSIVDSVSPDSSTALMLPPPLTSASSAGAQVVPVTLAAPEVEWLLSHSILFMGQEKGLLQETLPPAADIVADIERSVPYPV